MTSIDCLARHPHPAMPGNRSSYNLATLFKQGTSQSTLQLRMQLLVAKAIIFGLRIVALVGPLASDHRASACAAVFLPKITSDQYPN
jgi:hypothetical protein